MDGVRRHQRIDWRQLFRRRLHSSGGGTIPTVPGYNLPGGPSTEIDMAGIILDQNWAKRTVSWSANHPRDRERSRQWEPRQQPQPRRFQPNELQPPWMLRPTTNQAKLLGLAGWLLRTELRLKLRRQIRLSPRALLKPTKLARRFDNLGATPK